MPTLAALGLATAALHTPLSYPGGMPPWSALQVDAALFRLRPSRPAGSQSLCADVEVDVPALGLATGDGARLALDEALTTLGHPPLAARTPLVAVGSNASPGQLRHKFERAAVPAVVPLVWARVSGVRVAHSAHVSAPGYVPAAPVASPGTTTRCLTLWVDPVQLACLDATEVSNYRRVPVPEGVDVTVELPEHPQPEGAAMYVTRRGVLGAQALGGDEPGTRAATGLLGQPRLIAALLARSPALERLVGSSVDAFVRSCRASTAVRREVRRILVVEGWVGADGFA